MLITHDMGAVAEMADRVAVMYAGRIVEKAAPSPTSHNAACTRTRGLIDLRAARARSAGPPSLGDSGSVPAVERRAGCLFAALPQAHAARERRPPPKPCRRRCRPRAGCMREAGDAASVSGG